MRRRNVTGSAATAGLVGKFVLNVIQQEEIAVNDIVSMLWNSPSLWGSLSAAAVTYLVLSNWSTIRRLSKTVRFVDDRGYAAAVQGDLRALAKRQYNPNAPELNRMRELRRRMGRLGVQTPAPGLLVQDLEIWSAFVLDLLDCMNAKDPKRAQKLLDRLGQ